MCWKAEADGEGAAPGPMSLVVAVTFSAFLIVAATIFAVLIVSVVVTAAVALRCSDIGDAHSKEGLC